MVYYGKKKFDLEREEVVEIRIEILFDLLIFKKKDKK